MEDSEGNELVPPEVKEEIGKTDQLGLILAPASPEQLTPRSGNHQSVSPNGNGRHSLWRGCGSREKKHQLNYSFSL